MNAKSAFACAVVLAVGWGCAGGTVIVDYAIDAEVAVKTGGGGTGEQGAVARVPRSPGLLSPFDAVKYEGPDFEWTFGTGTLGLGGSVRNRSSTPVCLRFDEAQMRSNLHPQPVPLRIYSWSTFQDKWNILGSTDPKRRQDFRPPVLCVDSGKETRVSFAPDLAAVFPTQKMFNVRWTGDEPQLVDKGLGNWIALSVPMEIGERREVLDVKLTAIDSRARISGY